MIEQEVLIQLSDDPFDTKKIKVVVPVGTKLMTNKVYTKELLQTYLKHEVEHKPTHVINSKYPHQGTTPAQIDRIIKRDGVAVEALVNIDSKFTASCALRREPSDIVSELVEGMQIDVKLKSNKNGEVVASIGDAINEVKINEILSSINDKSTAFKCKVEELIHGGYWVNISGIRCFMPGSLAGLNKLYNFDLLLGKELIVMPITFSKVKQSIVVSHREYLTTLIPDTIDELRETIKEPRVGFVTGSTSFGVFVEFDECLTGLIPLDELDDNTLALHTEKQIKPGDKLNFWAKEVISNKKIILSQKGPRVDLWDGVHDKYKAGMIVPCVVKKLTKHGAFVELERGIVGLLHKSQIVDMEVLRGDSFDVRIKYVNATDRKISLTLPN